MSSQIAFHGLPLQRAGWAVSQTFRPYTKICAPLWTHPHTNRVAARRLRQRSRHSFPFRQQPLALASANAASVLAEDVLLQFQTSSGARRLARTVKPDGKRNWIVVDANGVSYSVSSKQVSFILGPSAGLVTESSDLTRLDEVCHRKAAENEDFVQVIWEVVTSEDGDSKSTDVDAIAQLLFADEDRLNLYVSHLLMANDKVYFKEKSIKGHVVYEARSKAQVRDAQLMKEAASAKERQLQHRRDAFLQACQDHSLEPLLRVLTESEVEYLVDCLKRMATELEGTSRSDPRFSSEGQNALQLLDDRGQQLVKEALSSLGKKVLPPAAMDLLVTWHVYSKHENLALLKSDLPHLRSLDPILQGHVDVLLNSPPEDIDRENRRDLSHLAAYAIDSADTSEVDDAISWDSDSGRIYVHVADPTRYFPEGPSNPILQEALRRAVTLYLPYSKLTMFPHELATNLFSLDGIESDNSALSFSFRIEEDGSLAEDSISIEATKISTPIRYTYDEAEAILSGAPASTDQTNLNTVYTHILNRKHWREMEGGAVIVNTPFSEVAVSNVDQDDPDISMGLVLTNSKAWVLVSEVMITACAVAAQFAGEAGLPVPFRGQEPFDYPEDDVLESFPDGPVRAAVAFRNATPSQIRTEPIEHASLGLDAYLQVTSPIRRSTDLVAHFQLKARLRGQECSMSVDDVRKEIGRSSEMSRAVRNVENRTRKYWQLEYLRRLGPLTEHDGVYVRQLKEDDNRLAFVHFEEYGFQIVASVPSNAKPGSKLKLRVLDVDPRTNMSRIEGVLALSEENVNHLSEVLQDAFSDISS